MSDEKDDLLKIDLARLEEACQNQSPLLRQWGDKLAKAKKDAALAENNAKLVKAQMGKKIRARPEAYGLDKTTDAVVSDAAICSKEYQEAILAQFDSEENRDIVKSMYEAVVDRRTEIESLVKLHGQMYFAKPNTNTEQRPKHDPTQPIGKAARK